MPRSKNIIEENQIQGFQLTEIASDFWTQRFRHVIEIIPKAVKLPQTSDEIETI